MDQESKDLKDITKLDIIQTKLKNGDELTEEEKVWIKNPGKKDKVIKKDEIIEEVKPETQKEKIKFSLPTAKEYFDSNREYPKGKILNQMQTRAKMIEATTMCLLNEVLTEIKGLRKDLLKKENRSKPKRKK